MIGKNFLYLDGCGRLYNVDKWIARDLILVVLGLNMVY